MVNKNMLVLLLAITGTIYGQIPVNPGGGGGGGATLPFPGIVFGTSASGGTVASSGQIQTAIGAGVYPTVANNGSDFASKPTTLDNLNGTSSTQVNPQLYSRFYDVNTPGSTYKQANLYGLNLDPILMPHLTGCIARVRANTGDCRIMAVGDSTTFGVYSNGGITGDLVSGSYPVRLAQLLTSLGIPAQSDAFFGDGTAFQTTCANDGRVNCGSWVQGTVSNGGDMFTASAAATLTFTPKGIVDSATIWYATFTTNGTITFGCDGNTPTSISTAVSGTNFASTTITCPSAGHHVFTAIWASGGPVNIDGIEAFSSTQHAVRILPAGWSGAVAANWAVAGFPYSPTPAVTAQAPDVVIVDLGINDWRAGLTSATYKTTMQSLITAWKVHSDVVIEAPVPSNLTFSAFTTQANQNLFVTAMYELAISNNIPIIDQWSRWQSYAIRSVAPFLFYGDTSASPPGLHPSNTGYIDFAENIINALSFTFGPGNASSNAYTAQTIPVGGPPPTVAVGAAAGTSPGTPTITGTNQAGVVTVITGTATTTAATLATVSFGSTLTSAPQGCTLMPNSASATGALVYTTSPSSTAWTVSVGGTALTASTTYSWSYACN